MHLYQDFGFQVQGSGIRLMGLGMWSLWYVKDSVQLSSLGSGFRVWGSGIRVQVSGVRGRGSGFRVKGSGVRGQG